MNRRDALARVGLIMGGAVIGGDLFLTGCSNSAEVNQTGLAFSNETVTFMNEVGETILPTTPTSPGAKEANVGSFMRDYVNNCYDEKNQKTFLDGIGKLDHTAQQKYGKGFVQLESDQKHELLVALDKEAKIHKTKDEKGGEPHYFTMMKQLSLLGYFTSETGATKALRHVPVPGKYEGCIPYQKGDKAWAY